MTNSKPNIHETAFIAEGVRIMGNVIIKKEASVWYNSVIRCDRKRFGNRGWRAHQYSGWDSCSY